MYTCACRGCPFRTGDGKTTFFRFPKDPEILKIWVKACHRDDLLQKPLDSVRRNYKLCEHHFESKYISKGSTRKLIFQRAIPTIFFNEYDESVEPVIALTARVCSIHFDRDSFEIPLKQQLLNYTPRNSRHLKCDAVPTLHLPGDPKMAEECTQPVEPVDLFPSNSLLCEEEFTPDIVETEAADGHMRLEHNSMPTFHLDLVSDTSDRSLSSEPQISNVRLPPRQMKRKRSKSPLRIRLPVQASSRNQDHVNNMGNQEINEMITVEDSNDSHYEAEIDPLSTHDENKPSRTLEENGKESDMCYILITLDPTLAKTKEMETSDSPMLQSLLKKGSVKKPQESSTVRLEVQSVDTQSEENVTVPRKLPEPPDTIKSLEKKVEYYKKRCETQDLRIASYQKQIKESDKLIKKLQYQLKESLHKTLYGNQVEAVKVKTSINPARFVRVSDVKMFKELRLRFICGRDGYEEMSKQVIPLPPEKVLQNAIEDVNFEPGILDGIFDYLKVKIDCLTAIDRDCCLIIEEKQIESERTYDADRDKYFGNTTVAPFNDIATHVVVFFLAGLNNNWKQIVAYHFTGGSIEESVFKDILKGVLKKAIQSDLNVVSITTDIEAKNQSIWENLNRNYGPKAIENTIEHPLSVLKIIHILGDVPKLFKRLKSIFRRNETITLPKVVKEANNFETSVVSSAHINELLSLQSICRLRVVPKPAMEDLLPFQVDERPAKSNKIRNLNIASALKHCASALNKPEYMATAYFLDNLEKWYYIMTAKVSVAALNKHDEDTYTENLCFLRDFMRLFEFLDVENDPLWRDTQIGVLVSTKSMVQVQNILLGQKNHDYLLTGRFFGSALEQLFEELNCRNIITNAQNVQRNLKVLSVAEYMQCPKSSCNDGGEEAIFKSINFSGVTNQDRIKQEEEILSSEDEVMFVEDFNGGTC